MLSDSGGGAKHPTELSHTALWAGLSTEFLPLRLAFNRAGMFRVAQHDNRKGYTNSGIAFAKLKFSLRPLHPPMCTMLREGGTKSGSPMWWRSSFWFITSMMNCDKRSSLAPRRISP